MIPIKHGLLIFLQVASVFYLLADLFAHCSTTGLAALALFTASWFALDHIEAAIHVNDYPTEGA
jgi:hypothetical protein